MANPIIRGVEATQHGRRILVGVISANELALLYESKRLKVDEYSTVNPDGYQRTLSKTRSRRFGRFISNREKGISPTTVLIYCRDTVGGIQRIAPGQFEVSLSEEDETSLYICDGQHRTDGIAEALKEGWITDQDDFDVPLTILFWDPDRSPRDLRLEEAMQFFTINTQQKRMRTDLAHEYIFKQHEMDEGPIGMGTRLTRMKKRDYIPYKMFIVKKLRTEQNSPWRNLILSPNEKGELPIKMGSFTDSLTPVIDYAVMANLTTGEVISIVENFWNAVFELCSDAYNNHKEYVLMKTPGVYALHLFLPVLMIRKSNLNVQSTPNEFEKVLQSVGDCFTNQFWRSKDGEAATFGTGGKAFNQLADHIANELSHM